MATAPEPQEADVDILGHVLRLVSLDPNRWTCSCEPSKSMTSKEAGDHVLEDLTGHIIPVLAAMKEMGI